MLKVFSIFWGSFVHQKKVEFFGTCLIFLRFCLKLQINYKKTLDNRSVMICIHLVCLFSLANFQGGFPKHGPKKGYSPRTPCDRTNSEGGSDPFIEQAKLCMPKKISSPKKTCDGEFQLAMDFLG